MKKAFALSIVLWISVIFMAISIYFLKVSKTNVQFSNQINDKLNAYLKAKTTLEDLKFYLGSGHYVYNKVFNNLNNYKNFLRVDNYEYNISDVKFKLQDLSGLYHLWGLDNSFIKFLSENNISKEKANEAYNSYLDWIDKDNLMRVNGAEKEYYISKKYNYLPRNANIPIIYELLDIRGWKNIFNLTKSYISLGNIGTSDNFTVMPLLILKAKYNISNENLKELMKLKKENKMNEFVNYFYQIPKAHFDYESTSYFNSKIVLITIFAKYNQSVYKLYELIDFNKNKVRLINF